MKFARGRFLSVDRRAIAAVEFALIVPFLLALFIGLIAIVSAFRTEAKLNAMVESGAQMLSVVQAVSTSASSTSGSTTTSSLPDICEFAVLGLQPLPRSGLTIDIASVTEEKGPNALPASGAAHASTATYDVWEQDYAVSNGICSATAKTGINSLNGNAAPIALAEANILQYPCDNVIIVRANLSYAGPTGVSLPEGMVLTQTAYNRWIYSRNPKSELLCATCTLPNNSAAICNASNSATN